jgi:hypothetical protein
LVDVSKIYEKEHIAPKKKRRYIQLTKDAKHMIKIQEQKNKKFIDQQQKDIKDRIYDFIVKEAFNLQK